MQPGGLDFPRSRRTGNHLSEQSPAAKADKVALVQDRPHQIPHLPDRREGSKSSLILESGLRPKSNHPSAHDQALKEELLAWLEKMKQGRTERRKSTATAVSCSAYQTACHYCPGRSVTKVPYRQWRAEHPGLRRSCSTVCATQVPTYQLLQSGGDFKSVQGSTGRAAATVLMDTYAPRRTNPGWSDQRRSKPTTTRRMWPVQTQRTPGSKRVATKSRVK